MTEVRTGPIAYRLVAPKRYQAYLGPAEVPVYVCLQGLFEYRSDLDRRSVWETIPTVDEDGNALTIGAPDAP